MKLCPQCDFIYEDDQRFCDMDGKELVYGPAPVAIEANVASPSDLLPKRASGRRSRNFAVAVVVGVVLTALVIAGYFARARQTRLRNVSQAAGQSPERSIDRFTVQPPAQSTFENGQPSASDTVATQTPLANTALAEAAAQQSLKQLPDQLPSQADTPPSGSASAAQPSPSGTSLAHTGETTSPVSAGAPSGNNRESVIVWLNNGASIRADEAWETKEGIWYRQAGMVTFLKRSRVRTIERLAPPSARSKSATSQAKEKSRKTEHAETRKQLRLARLEPADTKQQSRVASFLKRTGRILKKPFKF